MEEARIVATGGGGLFGKDSMVNFSGPNFNTSQKHRSWELGIESSPRGKRGKSEEKVRTTEEKWKKKK